MHCPGLLFSNLLQFIIPDPTPFCSVSRLGDMYVHYCFGCGFARAALKMMLLSSAQGVAVGSSGQGTIVASE
jgi:hypothetical protein